MLSYAPNPQTRRMTERPITIAHVTHEATEKFGGIGTVLEGLITAPAYQRAVKRTILISPLFIKGPVQNPLERLGPEATRVLYSGPDNVDAGGWGEILRPIEWAFGTPIVYGLRHLQDDSHHAEAEVLLFDVTAPEPSRLAALKFLLFEKFGLDAQRYESSWDFEEYCRLADPAFHALIALLAPGEFPAVLISHEYMGMCTALRAAADSPRRFRTVFHAHECSTARSIVEHHSGHDLAFYQAMRRARAKGQHVEQVFGPQTHNPRHALISLAPRLDLTLAVGDATADELRFLNSDFDRHNLVVCYNGVPSEPLTRDHTIASRALLNEWSRRALGFTPDYWLTHVTRPVISKGIWRDILVLTHLERELKKRAKTAAYLLLACGATPRTAKQADAMARDHRWPLDHREGYPDLAGPEIGLWHDFQKFNNPGREGSGAVRAVFVNQFGFTPDRLGSAAPNDLSLTHLRRASDVEFGQSIYEPFGIAHLEPLHAGAICIPTTVCGCVGYVKNASDSLGWNDDALSRNVIIADYTSHDVDEPLAMTRDQRDRIESRVAADVARRLLDHLPTSEENRLDLLDRGQALASRMSWDRVADTMFLPALRNILH